MREEEERPVKEFGRKGVNLISVIHSNVARLDPCV
jgi:hypothetical protein